MERYGRLPDMDRSFDIEYWQRLGSQAIFEAGGHAVMLYTDVFRALAEFGAPLAGLSADDFAREGIFYQIGVPSARVDILMSIDGVKFGEAWPNRQQSEIGTQRVWFIGRLGAAGTRRKHRQECLCHLVFRPPRKPLILMVSVCGVRTLARRVGLLATLGCGFPCNPEWMRWLA